MTPLLREAGIGRCVSIVHLHDGIRSEAHYGASAHTSYEIGSLTKTMTASLLAHASEIGELTPETTLGSLLDLDGSPASGVTLEELASHRSGLPRMSTRRSDRAKVVYAVLRNRNPYTVDVATLLEHARAAAVTDRGKFSYSNLGAALLGQALAAHAGQDYPQLLRRQLFDRLGMSRSTTPLTPGDLPSTALTGYNFDGRSQQPWTMNAYAPAGGVRSTPGDVARYAQGLLDGTAPGSSALEPRWEAGDGLSVGYGWFTGRIGDVALTWHNGATAGFSSMLALDREHDAAVIVLANTAGVLDDIAIDILVGTG